MMERLTERHWILHRPQRTMSYKMAPGKACDFWLTIAVHRGKKLARLFICGGVQLQLIPCWCLCRCINMLDVTKLFFYVLTTNSRKVTNSWPKWAQPVISTQFNFRVISHLLVVRVAEAPPMDTQTMFTSLPHSRHIWKTCMGMCHNSVLYRGSVKRTKTKRQQIRTLSNVDQDLGST